MLVMEIVPTLKEIKPANFLYYRKELKMSELEQMAPVSQEVYREAVRQNLNITGPVQWHYFGVVDKEVTFTLEVALPSVSSSSTRSSLICFS